ncbi:GNAT family N-acetyltransferase [Mycobacterium marinum]|uniref:GNAT family N-acetyltransferase n=1 Tax=Mycobacterium marinum TaxID=1781 RepID=UPI003562557F
MAHFPPRYLDSRRLLLRPPKLDDAGPIYKKIAKDPEVTRFLLWRAHRNVAETRRVLINQLSRSRYERNWVISLHGSGEIVGLISCRSDAPRSIEVGYCLGRQWWDMGFMSEALSLLLAGLPADAAGCRVWATCHVDNARSARLLQRAGFVLEARLCRHAVYPTMGPEPNDSLLYTRILRLNRASMPRFAP